MQSSSSASSILPSSLSSPLITRQTTPVAFAFTSIRSPFTKKQYPRRLKLFFDFIGLQGSSLEEQGQAFLAQAKGSEENNNLYWAEDNILLFLDFHKQRVLKKELAPGTLGTFYWAIKTFCDAHERDIPNKIDWKRISKALPKAKSYSNDRAPKVEEIRKLVEYSDRRIKPLVFVMCSAGIRLGAWEYLRWKHVTPITDEKTGEITAAKLIAYPDEHDQYYTFMTPEAYGALKEWMDYRALHGETINENSWLMRDKWRTVDVKRGDKCGRVGLATHPKKLSYDGIKKILNRALWDQGLRNVLSEGERRHDWKQAHGFRKFFKTRAEQVMNRSNVELLIGHSSGLQGSYYKPTEKEVLEDYLKAIPTLTINNDPGIVTLKEQQQVLVQRQEEKDKQIESFQEKLTTALDLINEWSSKFFDLNQKVQQQESEMKRLKMLERYYNKYG